MFKIFKLILFALIVSFLILLNIKTVKAEEATFNGQCFNITVGAFPNDRATPTMLCNAAGYHECVSASGTITSYGGNSCFGGGVGGPIVGCSGQGFLIGAKSASITNLKCKKTLGFILPAKAPGDLPNRNFYDSLLQITEWLLSFVIILTIFIIVYGGVYYITSAGEAERIESAKKIIMYSIVGLVISGLSYAIVSTVVRQILGS